MSWIDTLASWLGLPKPYYPSEHPAEIPADPDLEDVNRQVQEVRKEVVALSSRVSIAEKQLRARGLLPRRKGHIDDFHN
jgi:hypothetical protein